MWSTVGTIGPLGDEDLNHFVPLVHRPDLEPNDAIIDLLENDDLDAPLCSESSDVGASSQHTDDHVNVCNDIDVDSDEDDCVAKRKGETEGLAADGNCFIMDGGCLGFKGLNDVVHALESADASDILAEVPRGLKKDICFVVDNRANVERKAAGKKNQFWDDCGVWRTKDSRVTSRTYIRKENTMTVTQQVDGLYCRQQLVGKKRVWKPLDVQPGPESVIAVCTFYASLKADASYRKRKTCVVGCE